MVIGSLAERPESAGALTALLRLVWPEWYGPDGPGDATRDVAQRCRSNGMPLGLVAVDDEGHVVGTVSLGASSHGARGAEAPWIIGLAVHPDHRGRGLAAALIKAATERAGEMGHSTLFAATSRAAPIFREAGWEELRRHDDGTLIFRRALSPP